MNFIEVKPGKAVRVRDISSVTKKTEVKSLISVGPQTYEINYPYTTLLSILNNEDKVLKEISKKVGELPIFAG